MDTSFSAVIALLSLSLVSVYLDKETFGYAYQHTASKIIYWIDIWATLILLFAALIELPYTAEIETLASADTYTQRLYWCCSIMAVATFLMQAGIRGALAREKQEINAQNFRSAKDS